MASDLQKTITGALFFCASAFTGDAYVIAAVNSIGVNWPSHRHEELWREAVWVNAPGLPLTQVARRTLEQALIQLEADYCETTSCVDEEAFIALRSCLTALDDFFLAKPADVISARNDYISGLETLLANRPALDFVKEHLLLATVQLFQEDLKEDNTAWQLYYSWLTERLITWGRAQNLSSTLADTNIKLILSAIVRSRTLHKKVSRRFELRKTEKSVTSDNISVTEDRFIWINKNIVSEQTLNENLNGQILISLKVSDNDKDNIYEASALADDQLIAFTLKYLQRALEKSRPPALLLTLQFTPTATGAQVRWSADEIGAYTSVFTTPYPGAALPAVLRALEQRQHPAFALEPGDMAQLAARNLLTADGTLPPDFPRRVGRALYAALVSGPGIAAFAVAQTQAMQTNRPLALRLLLDPVTVELAALPWELLWASGPAPLLLSATPSLILTRHLDRPDPLPPLVERRGRPLRILALMPQVQRTPGELAATQRELARLWAELRATGTAEITEISPVTRADLARAMRNPPDIVQFTGHGWYTDGRGVLMLDPSDSGASADLVNADEVAVALRGARMVLLTACRGGQSAGITGGTDSLLTGVAPALSALGIPIVVGMQLGLRVDSALRASAAIYSALAAGQSAQGAVGRARDELYVTETQDGAWYVPVLYVATRDGGPVYI